MTKKKAIKTLEKRRDHLEKRIDQNFTKNLSFDEQEVQALNIALQSIKVVLAVIAMSGFDKLNEYISYIKEHGVDDGIFVDDHIGNM